MDDKKKKLLLTSSMLNLFTGVLFVLAAFHPLTDDMGIDYVFIFIGIVFLVLGLMALLSANRKLLFAEPTSFLWQLSFGSAKFSKTCTECSFMVLFGRV